MFLEDFQDLLRCGFWGLDEGDLLRMDRCVNKALIVLKTNPTKDWHRL